MTVEELYRKPNLTVEEQQQMNSHFLQLQKEYQQTHSPDTFSLLWLIVHRCALSLAKKHFSNREWNDIANSATVAVMRLLQKGVTRCGTKVDIQALPPYLMCWVRKYGLEQTRLYQKESSLEQIKQSNNKRGSRYE